MMFKGMLRLAAVVGFPLAALGHRAPAAAPVPNDPLETATGPAKIMNTSSGRQAALDLLARARNNYSLKSAGRGYDLKVSFTVTSGGQTEYDGDWEMEEIFSPQSGTRWTAKTAAGYTTTHIAAYNHFYGDGTATTIPLRLHEARAALLGAIPTNPNRRFIRTSVGTYNAVQVTCVLLAGPSIVPTAGSGRRWDEIEECIDPQSGLLQVHSQVPGRYYGYDYTDALKLNDCILPRKVIVTEAGKIVAQIHVDSLTEMHDSDPSLFVPTDEMKKPGASVAMAEAKKLSVFPDGKRVEPGATIQPVCVFGLVTASGQLVEAHSLQPSDPNSQAAVEYAKSMSFFSPTPPSDRPAQHFVFIIEKFVAAPGTPGANRTSTQLIAPLRPVSGTRPSE